MSQGLEPERPVPERASGWANPMREIGLFLRPIRARWRRFRNSRIGDPAFQTRAARFALTRPVARQTSRELFDLCAGFAYSQILSAAVELDLFGKLGSQSLTAAEAGERLDLSEDAARRLLRACVSLDLLEMDDETHFSLGRLGAALMANPGAQAMIRHHTAFYEDMRDPVALLRGKRDTQLAALWPYGGKSDTDPSEARAGAAAAYSDLMAESQEIVGREVVGAVDLSWARRIVDIGGGSGRFAARLAERYPQAELHLVDLPAVAEIAERDLASRHLADRVTVHRAHFLDDPLPEAVDCVTLVRILHDHDDATVLSLLKRVRAMLNPGGIVLIAEPMAGSKHSAPVADAYFGFYLLAMGNGRARTPDEIARLCFAAGLYRAHEVTTALPVATRIVRAEVPRRDVHSS